MAPTNIQYKYRWKYKYSARMSSPEILRKTELVQGSTTGSRKQWEAMTFFASQWSIIMSLATMLECYLEPYETALGSFGYIFHLGYNLIRFPPGFLEVKNGKVIQISFLVQGMRQYDNGRTWYEETKCLPCPEQRMQFSESQLIFWEQFRTPVFSWNWSW